MPELTCRRAREIHFLYLKTKGHRWEKTIYPNRKEKIHILAKELGISAEEMEDFEDEMLIRETEEILKEEER